MFPSLFMFLFYISFAINAISVTTVPTTTIIETTSTTPACRSQALCYNGTTDCDGKRCLNLGFIGTCKCTGCVQFLQCKSDKDCGGLRTACNLEKKKCDCDQGFINNGFAFISSGYTFAQLTFCNKRACGAHTDTCFGLECRAGVCICTLPAE